MRPWKDHRREDLSHVRRVRGLLAQSSERLDGLGPRHLRDAFRVKQGLEQIEAELDAIVRDLATDDPW